MNNNGFNNYLKWCKKYNLKACRYENLILYSKLGDMGFNFDELNDYSNELTPNQTKAIRG